ncbi:MAG: o-succinylbenzoate synthase [Isosphaeraceae bacterium]
MTTTGPVERVVLTHLQIPFKEPFRISVGEVTIKDAILVAVETQSAIGLGESSPMAVGFGYSPDTPEGCWHDLATCLAPALLGQSFATTEDINQLTSTWRASRFAVAGVETALWDLLGQAHHATIAELLGASDARITLGVESGLAVGIYPSIVELIRTVESHLEAGYRRVKLKIRPGDDVELVRAVRQHFGDVPLMVDANGSYTTADLDSLRELDRYDLLMIEQPMAAADLEGSAALQRTIETPVCLDETAESLERTIAAIERGAGRIVNLKLQRVGGFGPAQAIHDVCWQHGVDCWVGSMPELGIGQAHGIQLGTLANCKYPSDLAPSARWFVDDYTVPLVEHASPGVIHVPDRPGLGYLVDVAKVHRYQVRKAEFTPRSRASVDRAG